MIRSSSLSNSGKGKSSLKERKKLPSSIGNKYKKSYDATDRNKKKRKVFNDKNKFLNKKKRKSDEKECEFDLSNTILFPKGTSHSENTFILKKILDQGVPDHREVMEQLLFFERLYAALKTMLQSKAADINLELLRGLRGTLEEYRVKNENHLVLKKPGSGPWCRSTMIWAIILHTHLLINYGEEEMGQKKDFEIPPEVSSYGLMVSDRPMDEYTMIDIDMAVNTMLLRLREVQEPGDWLNDYMHALERRISEIILIPQGKEIINMPMMRVQCKTSRSGEFFQVTSEWITIMSAFFASVKKRIWKYYQWNRIELAIKDKSLEAYKKLKGMILAEASRISHVEFLGKMNEYLLLQDYDVANETICLYREKPVPHPKDVIMQSLYVSTYRKRIDILQREDIKYYMPNVKSMKDAISMKSPSLFKKRTGKTWRNDVLALEMISLLFSNGKMSSNKALWMERFVRFERDDDPEPLELIFPMIIQKFGRFDVIFEGKTYSMRSAMRAFFLWCRFALSPKHFNRSMAGIEFNSGIIYDALIGTEE